MRHRNAGRKLSMTGPHRRSVFANMAASLIKHEQIKTTLPRAKELRPIVEKLITLGKRDSLHARRQAYAYLYEKTAVDKLFFLEKIFGDFVVGWFFSPNVAKLKDAMRCKIDEIVR